MDDPLRRALVAAILPASIASIRLLEPVRRLLCTAAQDETPVHRPFWSNLRAYAQALGCEIKVGGSTYNKGLFEDHATRSSVFAPDVRPYLAHEPVVIGPVVFAAEMNILPTAVRPLSGLQTYTRGKPAVFPHAKIQLESLPTTVGRDVPILTTTGMCTIPNYVQKKAGQKAELQHKIGAAIIEADGDGDWFIRQLDAEPDGSFQDLDVIARHGRISRGNRVESITWGDVHREQLDGRTALTAWGFDVLTDTVVTRDNMLDALRPRFQQFHDLLDFQARNHHRRGDPYHLFRMIANGSDDVERAVVACVDFLRGTYRSWCRSMVIESNHDRALARWLEETDWRADPRNAQCHLRWNARRLSAIKAHDFRFNIFRHALQEADPTIMMLVDFVPQDASRIIAEVEVGMHGDVGPNGGKGSMQSLIKLSQLMNIGHSHSAGILDGLYQAGVNGTLDMGYNRGPSSWTASDIVTYQSGKRAIVTKRGGKWRA